MEKIAFDIAALNPKFKAHSSRGIGRYVRELNSYFETHVQQDFYIEKFSSFEMLSQSRMGKCINFMPFGRTTLRQQCIGPFSFASIGAKFLHFPAHIDAPAWCPCPFIVTVLDLIPIIFEDLYKAHRSSWRFNFARWLEIQAIKNAQLVLCISNNTAKDAQRILGIPDEKLVVTPLGVDPAFFEAKKPTEERGLRARLGLPFEQPIVLYLGGIDQRKNIRGLISVFQETQRHFINENCVTPILVIAGDVSSDEQYPIIQDILRKEDLGSSVFWTGYLDDSVLLELFAISTVFFFPSFYEGFGLPPLEAMAAGLPVLSSNQSAMPEILGDGALFMNPSDIKEGAAALIRILSDKDFALSLSERGRQRARLFSWERTGSCTIEAYRNLLRK